MGILGGLRMPESQSMITHGMPTKRETTVIVHGIGKAFWHFLLVMLYITFRKNHELMSTPSFNVSTSFWGNVSLPAGHSAMTHSSMASSSMHVGSASGTTAASSVAASSMCTNLARICCCAGRASRGAVRTAATGIAVPTGRMDARYADEACMIVARTTRNLAMTTPLL